MGLDVVEVVLECERTFRIKFEDDRVEVMRTVGDLFELICEELGLQRGDAMPMSKDVGFVPLKGEPSGSWDRATVWVRLVRLVRDQLQIPEDEVTYGARFNEDLGAD